MVTKDESRLCTKSIIERDILLSCGLSIRNIMSKISSANFEDVEEIRIRINRPLMATCSKGDWMIDQNGLFVSNADKAYIANETDLNQTLELMSENSLYAYQEELRNGFLTLRGGHRVGLVGKVVTEKNEIKTLKNISGLNIRIAREVKGCANSVINFIVENDEIYHTLVISPPGCGKTTLLRDIVRQISTGSEKIAFRGAKVGLVDERSEIAACFRGMPQNDVGIRTDVLDSCPKPQGILLLVRSMSPRVIVTDELGTRDDIDAVESALNAGIKIITTAHARNIDELERKPGIGELFRQGLFERIIVLSNAQGPGTIEEVIDGTRMNSLWRCKNAS